MEVAPPATFGSPMLDPAPGNFLPASVGSLTEQLVETTDLPGRPVDASRFRSFSRIAGALIHYRSHSETQALVEAWNDGTDHQAIGEGLEGLLEDGNFEPVTQADIDEALVTESLVPLRFSIDLDDYETLTIARRGSHPETVTIEKLKGLRTIEKTITVDDEVVIHSLVRTQEWFDERGIDPAERNLQPGERSLKMFKSVPRADLEMLLPSVQVTFRPIDRLVVGVPAVASGIVVLATKLAPTLGLLVLLLLAAIGLRDDTPTIDQAALAVLFGGAVTLGGFLFRQYAKFKNRRVEHLKTLTENLYFRTVGDGPGVIHTLFAAAEEQETLEVLIAYRVLAGAGTMTAKELDGAAEAWLAAHGMPVDFEVDDALDKLEELDLLERRRVSRKVDVVPLPEALLRLDRRWDDLFDFTVGDEDADSADTPDRNEGLLARLVRRATGRAGITTDDASTTGE